MFFTLRLNNDARVNELFTSGKLPIKTYLGTKRLLSKAIPTTASVVVKAEETAATAVCTTTVGRREVVVVVEGLLPPCQGSEWLFSAKSWKC